MAGSGLNKKRLERMNNASRRNAFRIKETNSRVITG